MAYENMWLPRGGGVWSRPPQIPIKVSFLTPFDFRQIIDKVNKTSCARFVLK